MRQNPQIHHLPQAQEFVDSLKASERNKVNYNIRKTEAGLTGKWFKSMTETDGLWEFRTLYNNKKFRLLAFWDTTNKKEPLIITTNGFIKKTKKTPKKEIEKAENMKKEYFKRIA